MINLHLNWGSNRSSLCKQNITFVCDLMWQSILRWIRLLTEILIYFNSKGPFFLLVTVYMFQKWKCVFLFLRSSSLTWDKFHVQSDAWIKIAWHHSCLLLSKSVVWFSLFLSFEFTNNSFKTFNHLTLDINCKSMFWVYVGCALYLFHVINCEISGLC